MAFCLNYKRNRDSINKVDQIIIKYHPSNNLLNFLKSHSNQRIIIDIQDANLLIQQNGLHFFTLLHQAKDNPNNWAIRFPSVFSDNTIDLEHLKILQDLQIPFFFNTYVDRWDILYGMFNLGVSDVYIVNELGFEIDKVSPVVHNHNCKVRVFPNIAQSAWYNTPDLKKFFIRPEDIDDYKRYVDIFEFFEPDDNSSTMGDILYHVYAEDKEWYGRLKEIIINLDSNLDGRFTHPLWVTRRVRCGKKCLKGSHCDMCNTIASLGETLERVGITVGRTKEEKPMPSEEEMKALVEKYYGADAAQESFLPKDTEQKITETINAAEANVLDAIEQAIKNGN